MSRTLSRLKRKVGFLLRHCSGKGPHLALKGESPVFSRVAAGNFGFLSSYDGDLRDPLVGQQESPVSMRAVRDGSGFFCSNCRGQGPHLELRPEPQGSSPLLTWISVLLWSFHRGVRPHVDKRHTRPLASRAMAAVSGFPVR